MQISITATEFSRFQITDLCSLFANALENALHACQQMNPQSQRYISLKVYEKNTQLCIQIKNSYEQPVVFADDIPISRSVNHGIGVQSMISVVEKYHGVYGFFADHGEDRKMAIKALEYSVHGRSVPFGGTMTIRKYCTYFRIANEVYEAFHRKRGFRRRIHTDPQDVPEELRDVAYYNRKKFVDVTEMYDIDSPDDFMRFATDHYGELGLSRLNIFASNDRQQGWRIVVSNSYSANAGLAIEVATSLYKAGAPLLIYDAEKLLRILREEDYVRLVPDSYHNYMGYQEEGSVYELPWEYECSEGANSVLTKEQYQAIVSLAEWQPEERVRPIA